MALRNIRKYGDSVLRKKFREVEKIDERLVTLIKDMLETMTFEGWHKNKSFHFLSCFKLQM